MAEEIELKLSIPESAQSRFRRHQMMTRAGSRRTVRLMNLYYDTPQLDLMRRGIALRLRNSNGDWLQTVKRSAVSEGGLTSRPEWETPYGGHFDFSGIDDKQLRRYLERHAGKGRFVPVFETNFLRTTWRVENRGGTVDVMLDRGWIAAAGRREPISEVEIERVSGAVGTIFAVARALADKIPLAPAPRSKAERGYRLFRGEAARPYKAVNAAFPADISPCRAFRITAFACLSHLQVNRDGAVASDDPEYVHQARVAIRRLRAALRLFRPALPGDLAPSLLPDLRSVATALGQTRDLDVLHTEIVAPVLATMPDEPRLAALDGEITERRFAARRVSQAHLNSIGYGRMMVAAAERLTALPDDEGMAPALQEFARKRLKRLRCRVVRMARSAAPDDPASLHALRIAVKRLRYGLEFFGHLARGRRLAALAFTLAQAQDTLGKLNDLANAGRLLEECAGNDRRMREAVGITGGWHGPRYARLMAEVPALLKRLSRITLPRLG